MNAEKWRTKTRPTSMLSFLLRDRSRFERPLRFFALGACRLVWPALTDERSRRAVETAELALVGLAPQAAVAEAARAALAAYHELNPGYEVPETSPMRFLSPEQRTKRHTSWMAAELASTAATRGATARTILLTYEARRFDACGRSDLMNTVDQHLCHVLREVTENPFGRGAFSPDWRTDTALALAREMYATNDFSAMPILADALQDAGCDNEAILNHCRDTAQTHLRGCWVIESLLGSA